MDILKPLDLGDRQLWIDGTSTVTPDKINDILFQLAGTDKIAVTELTEEIKAYNALSDHPIKVKSDVDLTLFPPEWILPDDYKYMSLDEKLIGLVDHIEHDDLYEKRVERLSHEIWLFKELKLDNILRTLFFIVDTMKNNNVVWGVGRGSSCSSYLLFLIGLHEVDPVKYEIDITDFIHPQES